MALGVESPHGGAIRDKTCGTRVGIKIVLDGSMTLGGTVLGMTCGERNLGVTRLGATGAVNGVMSSRLLSLTVCVCSYLTSTRTCSKLMEMFAKGVLILNLKHSSS